MIHGECKMTGGKLVTVDLQIEDGRISEVRLRGDFFIHPEPRTAEVITSIEKSITDLSVELQESAIAAHVAAAVPFGVELIGTSPDAIALAIRRAITGNGEQGVSPNLDRVGALPEEVIQHYSEIWNAIPWRIIPEQSLSPAINVALDEVFTRRVSQGLSAPTLRFWRWSTPAVIVGRCQSIANEVDQAEAEKRGIAIVRRMTGGGAMFLQPHGAITYSLYLPESSVTGLSIRQSYEFCEWWVIRGLRELGIDAHHVPINDIACSAGKIGGAAQARRGGVVLHHTTMAYDMDPGEMIKVLRIGREKLKDKAVASAQKRVSPLVSQTGKSREEIVNHLFQSFRKHYGGEISEITSEERAEADATANEKYSSPAWTHEFD